MRYLTLELIKSQCIIDQEFTDDDTYLSHLGDVAEEAVENEIDNKLEEVVASNNGKLPAPLLQAMLIYVDYFYGLQRGSDGNNPDIPKAFLHLCAIYRNWGVTR